MNVGDYVRSHSGTISKIKSKNRILIDGYKYDYTTDKFWFKEEDIKKSSPNIIDLIEVGDYVNSEEVYQLFDGKILNNYNDEIKNIKEILTHEQYTNNCYKVGEE